MLKNTSLIDFISSTTLNPEKAASIVIDHKTALLEVAINTPISEMYGRDNLK